MKPIPTLAWNFVGSKLPDGRPAPASFRIVDALTYACGDTLCRVACSGTIEARGNKIVASKITTLWRMDAGPVLRLFARECALGVAHLWNAPDHVREYLRTGDDALRAAARATALIVARDAELAAMDASAVEESVQAATWAAVEAAAWATASCAAEDGPPRSVALAAARDSAEAIAEIAAARAPAGDARASERTATRAVAQAVQEVRLVTLVKAAHAAENPDSPYAPAFRYQVAPIANADCDAIDMDTVILATDDLAVATEAAENGNHPLHASYPFGVGILDTESRLLDVGFGFGVPRPPVEE